MKNKNLSKNGRRRFMATLGGAFGGLLFFNKGNAHAVKTELKGWITTISFENLADRKPTRLPRLIRRKATVYIKGDPAPIFRLNKSGRLIWDSCDGSQTMAEISRKIHEAFGIPLQQAQRDCFEFLTHLNQKHLIRL